MFVWNYQEVHAECFFVVVIAEVVVGLADEQALIIC